MKIPDASIASTLEKRVLNENNSLSPSRKSSGIARVAMWVGGSALFGSLALVLWNRRALKSMHEAPEVPDPRVLPSDDDIY